MDDKVYAIVLHDDNEYFVEIAEGEVPAVHCWLHSLGIELPEEDREALFDMLVHMLESDGHLKPEDIVEAGIEIPDFDPDDVQQYRVVPASRWRM